MEYRPLGNTGLKLPILGFGASSLGQEFRQVDVGEALRSVRVALDEDPQDARRELEAHIAQIARADPWLRDHAPVIEWSGGQFASGRSSAPAAPSPAPDDTPSRSGATSGLRKIV